MKLSSPKNSTTAPAYYSQTGWNRSWGRPNPPSSRAVKSSCPRTCYQTSPATFSGWRRLNPTGWRAAPCSSTSRQTRSVARSRPSPVIPTPCPRLSCSSPCDRTSGTRGIPSCPSFWKILQKGAPSWSAGDSPWKRRGCTELILTPWKSRKKCSWLYIIEAAFFSLLRVKTDHNTHSSKLKFSLLFIFSSFFKEENQSHFFLPHTLNFLFAKKILWFTLTICWSYISFFLKSLRVHLNFNLNKKKYCFFKHNYVNHNTIIFK